MNRGDVILVRFPHPSGLTAREEAASRCCAVRRIHRGGQHARRRRGHDECQENARTKPMEFDV